MSQFYDNQQCFVCGKKNPHGLHLSFDHNEELGQVEAQVAFPAHLQGWNRVVHGGLISTVLDEIMIKAAAAKKIKCVTSEIKVRFKKPTLVEKRYTLHGRVTEVKRRVVFVESSIRDPGGEVTAQASAKLFVVD